MDGIDKRLISILMANGRERLTTIGRELGMSHVAVSKRLDKLRESNLLRVTAAVNGDAIDAKIVFLAIETENMEVTHRIVEKYRHCPRLIMLAPVTGRYNLFAVIVAEDMVSLESILGTCSLRVEEGVRRSEAWFGNAPVVPTFLPIDLAPEKSADSTAPCGFDCKTCRRFAQEKCVACPGTHLYCGSLWLSDTERDRRGKS